MLDILSFWSDLNNHLIEIVSLCPDELFAIRPEPQEWSIRDVAVHIAEARNHWLTNVIRDGGAVTALPNARSKADVSGALIDSWNRLRTFASNQSALDASHEPPRFDPAYLDPPTFNGHYVAFHRLVHDCHHRATILERLRQNEIALPPDRRRRPL